MAQKILDVSQKIYGFDKKPVPFEENGERFNMTLRNVLYSYLASVDHMGTTEEEQARSVSIGFKLGEETDEVELSKFEYKLVKKLCDYGKVLSPGKEAQYLFPPVVRITAQEMVDAAKDIDSDEEEAE